MRSHGREAPSYLELHEKNWCPFVAPANHSHSSKTLYLIKFVRPLEVVQILPRDKTRCDRLTDLT